MAFVKGTRTQPQCGFSHQVLTILTEVRCGVGAGVCVRTHTCARVYAVVVVVVVVEVVWCGVCVGGCGGVGTPCVTRSPTNTLNS